MKILHISKARGEKEKLKVLQAYISGIQAVKFFVEKYGVADRFDFATDLVAANPSGWNCISDELKRNPEILYYYQPIGFAVIDATALIMRRDENGEPTLIPNTQTQTCYQKGFRFEDGYQIPDMPFPEGFDIERYKDVQRALIFASSNFDRRKIKAHRHENKNLERDLINLFDTSVFGNHKDLDLTIDNIQLFDRRLISRFVTKPAPQLRIGTTN